MVTGQNPETSAVAEKELPEQVVNPDRCRRI
jgi:hypothetical protein